MYAMKWTKKGWKKAPIRLPDITKDHNGRDYTPIRSRISDVKEDFSSSPKNPEVAEVMVAQEEIMYGNIQNHLDQMSPMTRHVYMDPYNWIIGGGKLLKIIDPLTQAYEGQIGTDPEDKWKDSYLYEGYSLATMLYLEQSKLLGSHPTRDFDILDMFNDDEFQLGGIGSQANLNVEHIGSHDLIFEEQEEFDPAEINEEEFMSYDKSEFTAPIFGEKIQDKLEKISTQYEKDIEGLTPEEILPIRILAAKEIDKLVFETLTSSFSTCQAYGRYKAPSQRFDFIFNVDNSSWKEAADRRKEEYEAKIQSILNCKDMTALHGPLIVNPDKESEYKYIRKGGVFGILHEQKERDKAIIQAWSDQEFKRQRQEYVDLLRLDPKMDEETLRAKVYSRFDRLPGETDAEYDKEGNLSQNSGKWMGSWWYKEKTKAMMELKFTSGQWGAIYAARDLAKSLFSLTPETKTDNQKKWTEAILGSFSKIDNIAQYKAFKNWLFKRRCIDYQIVTGRKVIQLTKAPIDNLTIEERAQVVNSLEQIKSAILAQIKESKRIEKTYPTIIPTDFKEVEVTCYHLSFNNEGEDGCNRTIYSKPYFVPTEGDKGYMCVNCSCKEDGCSSYCGGKCHETGEEKRSKCKNGCHHKVFLRDAQYKIIEKPITDWKEILETK